MSGKHITHLQENIYMKNRQVGNGQETSAAKAGMSVRSGRRIEKGQRQETKERHWRTRTDPLEAVWDSELVPLLEREPALTGITLWEHLDETYPGRYPEHCLRTLQRRIKHWQATQGPNKAVIFRQSVPAGHQGLSDFTHPNTEITIAGESFSHLLYQFRLAYSGWRHVHIVQGGESYSALADGLQNALQQLGGVPKEHRTDSLSAAYVNAAQKQRLTDTYQALCQHYGMRPTTNNPGGSHENGAIEAPHGCLKRRIEQAVKLRGSADFSNLRAYRDFIEHIVAKLNKRCRGRLAEEQQSLRLLPRHRFIDYTELTVKVTTSSTISVKRALYTVPSRLIGENVRAILDDRKTQTRRVMKPQPIKRESTFWNRQDNPIQWFGVDEDTKTRGKYFKCPYGKPGDILWVRETFFCATGPPGPTLVHYKSDDEPEEFVGLWKSSRFIPRWASRIDLLIKDIRVERVQDISEEDAKAEGVIYSADPHSPHGNGYIPQFHFLWDSINAKRGYSWESNPFVWVVEFERVT